MGEHIEEPDGRAPIDKHEAPQPAYDVPVGKRRTGRRRFLTGVGATGLAVAVATFGRSTAAYAYVVGCCDLPHPPGDTCYISYAACSGASHPYLWTCKRPKNRPPLLCQCCDGVATKLSCDKGVNGELCSSKCTTG